jgi:hypothetical protein
MRDHVEEIDHQRLGVRRPQFDEGRALGSDARSSCGRPWDFARASGRHSGSCPTAKIMAGRLAMAAQGQLVPLHSGYDSLIRGSRAEVGSGGTAHFGAAFLGCEHPVDAGPRGGTLGLAEFDPIAYTFIRDLLIRGTHELLNRMAGVSRPAHAQAGPVSGLYPPLHRLHRRPPPCRELRAVVPRQSDGGARSWG